MNTPWGTADSIAYLSDTIVWVDTCGHGGLGIKNCKIDVTGCGYIRTMSGYTWFEEDCAWSVAALADSNIFALLQQYFKTTEEALKKSAHEMCSRAYPDWMLKNGLTPDKKRAQEWLEFRRECYSIQERNLARERLVENYLKAA